jgi:hypothetical protein
MTAKNPITISTFNLVAPKLPAEIAVLMRGPTGVGKSHLARQIADVHNLPFIDVRGSTMSEGDVGGYPDIEGMKESGVMTFCMPSWFIRACNEPVVLMLDELNRSLPGVQQSFFQLVLDRELGNDKNGVPYRLHPETRVIAAINFGSEYDVNDMDPALLRRFWVADIEPDVEDWVAWARPAGIDPLLINFMQTDPKQLRVDPSTVEPGTVCPNPASWHRFDTCVKAMGMAPSSWAGQSRPTGFYALALGMVGPESAASLCTFVEAQQKLLKVDEILAGEFTKKQVKDMPISALGALIENIGHDATKGAWDKATCDNVGKFGEMLTGEQLIQLWAPISKCGVIGNISNMHKRIGKKVMEITAKSRKLSKK